MSRPITFRNHSFRILLYLEWILLIITALNMLMPQPFATYTNLWLATAVLVVFGLMGLHLPGKHIYKVVYTGLEFALVLCPIVFGIQVLPSPLLYLIIAIRSSLMFDQYGRLVVSGLVLSLFLNVLFFSRIPFNPFIVKSLGISENLPDQINIAIVNLKLGASLTFSLAIIFVVLMINALLSERQGKEKLLIANEQLRNYALRIEDQATLQERNRIAREIHDSLGHALTAQSIQLENALLFLHSNIEKAELFLSEAKLLGARALHEVRQSIATLRSDPLKGKPLENAIAEVVEEFHSMTGIMPSCTIQPLSLTSEVSTCIYRITQEALTNICKHSHATKVKIDLQARNGMMIILIEDNGKGFNPDQNTTGFGLQGMKERAIALGGHFQITSQPEAGCKVRVAIPLLRINP